MTTITNVVKLSMVMNTIFLMFNLCKEVITCSPVPETKLSSCGKLVLGSAKKPSMDTKAGWENLLLPLIIKPLSPVPMIKVWLFGMSIKKLLFSGFLLMIMLWKMSSLFKVNTALSLCIHNFWNISSVNKPKSVLWNN